MPETGRQLLPCGHPAACIRHTTPNADGLAVHWCGWCADVEQARHTERQAIAAELHQLLQRLTEGDHS